MKLKQRILLALASALLLAGLCTFVLRRTMLHAAAASHAATRTYFTPTRSIHSGDLVRSDDIKPLSWPGDDAVHGALTRREDVINRVALVNIAPGEPVNESQLAPAGSGTGLASRIPNGMRAIALKSDEVIGVAGFLNPGSHVDVLVTCRNGMANDAVTTTVLQNVEVVATNQQIEPNPNGKPTTATVVTLLLTPPQAQRALLASNQGSLQLVLRNSSDVTTSDAAPIALSQMAPLARGPQAGALGAAMLPGAPAQASLAAPRVGGAAAKMAPKAAKAAQTENTGGVEMVFGSRSSQSAAPSAGANGGKL